jgi:hypothetical protein
MPSDFAPILREPVTVTVAGTQIVIPYRPAAVWARGLERLSLLAALLAEPDDRDRIADLLTDYPQAVDDLRTESLRILGDAAGRRWWEAGRLLSTSVQPEVLGRLVLANVDPWQRSVGEWCAAVYALCVKGQDEKGRIRFDFSLSIPPADHEDEWDDGGGLDPAAAMAAVAQMTGKR